MFADGSFQPPLNTTPKPFPARSELVVSHSIGACNTTHYPDLEAGKPQICEAFWHAYEAIQMNVGSCDSGSLGFRRKAYDSGHLDNLFSGWIVVQCNRCNRPCPGCALHCATTVDDCGFGSSIIISRSSPGPRHICPFRSLRCGRHWDLSGSLRQDDWPAV